VAGDLVLGVVGFQDAVLAAAVEILFNEGGEGV
jgi:hypothetical protein